MEHEFRFNLYFFLFFKTMDKKKCEYCNKTLRNTKRIDFVDRSHHFKCIKKIQEEQYMKLLADFMNFFKSHNILVRI